ncbi:MAG: BTAD domain-containing putative transcriptional regulator [Nitrospirota bacterium]
MVRVRQHLGGLAKISPPVSAKVLQRPRLFRLLDRPGPRRVLWVNGPPGSGKTTLVSSYLAVRRRKAIWYHLDAGDADPASLFYYLGLAAKKAAPRVRRPLPLLTPDRLPGLPVFTRRYFEALTERLPRPSVVVFDNYHELPSDSVIHDVMREGLTQIPEGVVVILISRNAPPPSLAAFHANGQMQVLNWDALRLTPPETRALISLTAGKRFSNDAMQCIQAKTDGWAAGVVLMLQHIKVASDAQSPAQNMSASVFDYFAGEVFAKLSRSVQEMLLRTAFLPSMTLGIAERLTGAREVGKNLADFSRSNYFVEERPGTDRIYRYHDLFREFLLSQARERFSAVELSRIRQRAATLLEESGRLEEAVDLYAGAGDWAAVQRIIVTQAPVLVEQGRSRTLQEWIDRLPKDLVGAEPWLLYWLGVCQFSYGVREGLRSFERAFELFQAADDSAGTWLAWSAAVDMIGLPMQAITGLDSWIEWLDQRMRTSPEFPSPDIEARVAASASMAMLHRQPQHPRLRRWVDRALESSRHVTDINLRIRVAMTAIHYATYIGDYAFGKAMTDEILMLAESPHAAPINKIIAATWEATRNWLVKADLSACLRTVNRTLELAEESGAHLFDGWTLAQGVYGSLCMGDVKRGAEYLDRVRAALRSGNNLEASHYHHLASWHAILVGNLQEALQRAKQATEIACQVGGPFSEAQCRLGLVQVLLERGRLEDVASHLGQVVDLAAAMNSMVLEHQCCLARAQIDLDLSDRKLDRQPDKDAAERGLAALRRAMAIGREQGYVNKPFSRPTVMSRLCATALEHGIEVDYVRHLIRKRNLLPEPSARGIEAWPWPVKVYTLGRFSILWGDQPLSMGRRSQHGKPLALLKALIAHGGRDVAQSELTEALWPEADGDAARQAFDTTLHRLRKLLGEETVFLADGRLTLDPKRVWVDLWSVERLIRDLDSTLKQPSPDAETVCATAEKLFRLYAGPFLREESDEAWALSRREKVHGRLVALLSELGRCCERGKDWERAVTYYQRGIELDPLVEPFYQHLMLGYQTLGRRAEALATYRRCRETLHAQLQIPPSPATETIHQQIRGAVT